MDHLRLPRCLSSGLTSQGSGVRPLRLSACRIDGPASPAADCSSKPLRGSRSALRGVPFAGVASHPLHLCERSPPTSPSTCRATSAARALLRGATKGSWLSARPPENLLCNRSTERCWSRYPRGQGCGAAAQDFRPAKIWDVGTVTQTRARSGSAEARSVQPPGLLNKGLQGRLRGLQSIFC